MSSPTPPHGAPDEISLDSPEDVEALAAAMAREGDDDGGAPWADAPERLGAGDLPPPEEDQEQEPMPRSVEGVGDLVADPLSRAKVIPRDDPGGPGADEVPPSPS